MELNVWWQGFKAVAVAVSLCFLILREIEDKRSQCQCHHNCGRVALTNTQKTLVLLPGS